MKRLFAVAVLAIALFGVPDGASALEPEQVKQLVIERAIAHDVSPDLLLCVTRKESRFDPSARGGLGERGVAQWLPGRGNAWDYTLAYQESGIDIIKEYEAGNPDATYFDVDGIAELFSRGRAYRWQHWSSTLRGCE